MKIPAMPFTVADWEKPPGTNCPGETGSATWRTLAAGDDAGNPHRASTRSGCRLFIVD